MCWHRHLDNNVPNSWPQSSPTKSYCGITDMQATVMVNSNGFLTSYEFPDTLTRKQWPMRSGSVPPSSSPNSSTNGTGRRESGRTTTSSPRSSRCSPGSTSTWIPSLIQLPLPALCIRLPKDKNPLTFDWKGKEVSVRCMLLGEMNDGSGISVLIDIGELMPEIGFPVYSYRNFRRQEGLTVEKALGELKKDWSAEVGIAIPDPLINDCVRLCCSLCLLENDPEVISPDVLADDRAKFEETGDQKYVDKARRRGKVGWDVGRHIEWFRITVARTWPWCGRVGAGGAADRATAGEHCPSGGGGEGAEGVWGKGKWLKQPTSIGFWYVVRCADGYHLFSMNCFCLQIMKKGNGGVFQAVFSFPIDSGASWSVWRGVSRTVW